MQVLFFCKHCEVEVQGRLEAIRSTCPKCGRVLAGEWLESPIKPTIVERIKAVLKKIWEWEI